MTDTSPASDAPTAEAPLLSIYCLVYNHAAFLRQCLDGFVMQRTSFPIEILIHDDASSDESQAIIREYVEHYPQIQWRPIYQTENQYSQGKMPIFTVMPLVRGRYVAFCEGDDYWTDPLKLQKQVDFLESHPDYSICHHPVRLTWDQGEKPDEIRPAPYKRHRLSTLTLSDLAKRNRVITASVVYRWAYNRDEHRFEDHFPRNVFPSDYILVLAHATRGKAKLLPDTMSTYRLHAGGVWSGTIKTDLFYVKQAAPLINFYIAAQQITGHDFRPARLDMLHDCILACFVTGHYDKLRELQQLYPADYEQIIQQYSKATRSNRKLQWQQKVASTSYWRFTVKKIAYHWRRLWSKSNSA